MGVRVPSWSLIAGLGGVEVDTTRLVLLGDSGRVGALRVLRLEGAINGLAVGFSRMRFRAFSKRAECF